MAEDLVKAKSVALVTGANEGIGRAAAARLSRDFSAVELVGPVKKIPEEVGIVRFAKPEEIADLMAFLVPPSAKWMTGSSIRTDAGEVKSVWHQA